ncbi:MAG: DUF4185 domain-containing protein [Clostridiales bacterium]|nr:DUF4185 domain-containing protein [Clostridiales bacterium]
MENLVKKVTGIEFLTGERNKNDASKVVRENLIKPYVSKNWKRHEKALVKGTDLGIPFYNSKNDTMYILFGDTFSVNRQRGSVMAISRDYDLSDGLTFDGYYNKNNDGYADELITTVLDKTWQTEDTKIPQGGIEIDGNVYIFYEAIRCWAPVGRWFVNYQNVLKSTDNCKTFEKVYDLTWFPETSGEYFEIAKKFAEQDMNLNDSGVTIDNKEDRKAPYFAQMYPVDGMDGYVYLFGRKAGRQHGIKSARVKKENIEIFTEYEYYLGNDKSQNPIWVKGYEGLKALDNDEVGFVLATNEDEPTSNMSVMFNKYLNKWMLVYFRPEKVDENGNKIYTNSVGFRLSDVPYGNYGEYHTILTEEFFKEGDHYAFMEAKWNYDKPASPFYGAFVHEKYTEENGKTFYLILSLAGAIYNSILLKVELE